MSKVYSYVRFSSKAQEFGDSQRRQVASARKYCEKYGLTLEKTTFEDLGVSAWKGKNVEKGQLGVFLKVVDDGLIPKDSTLLVEHLDRVSRNKPTQAHKLFIDIVSRGLTLVTLNDEAVYNEETIDGDMSKLFTAVVKLMGAHEENEKRARRIREVLGENAKNGIVRGRCPAWMRRSKDGRSYELIPQPAAAVRRMFDMALGGYGIYQIASALNNDNVPHVSLPRREKDKPLRWIGSHVARILRAPTTIGHMNARTYGEVRENTYPAVVEPSLFYAVGEAMDRRNKVGKGYKNGVAIGNLLAGGGLLHCECGGNIRHQVNRGKPYLICVTSLAGACHGEWFNYDLLEDELLSTLLLDSDQLLVKAPIENEPDERPRLRAEVEERKQRRSRLMTFVEENDVLDEDIIDRLNTLKAEIAERQETIRRLDSAADLVPDEAAEKNLMLFFEHYDAMHDGAPPEVLYDIRTRLQEALRTAIESVTLMLGDWYRDGEDEPMLCFEVRLRQAPDISLQLLCKAPRRRQ